METWIDTLPDDIKQTVPESFKSDGSFTKYKTFPDFLTGHKNAVELASKKGVILPSEGADEKEWEPVYNSLGRPEKPDGYKYQAPNGAKLNDAYLNEFKTQAHQMGMTQKQFEKLVNTRIEFETKEQKANTEAQLKFKQDGETSLRKEWGAKYDEKISMIQKAIKSFGGDLPADPKEYDPRLTKLIGSMAEHLSEATLGTLGIVKGGALTPEEAKEKIASIRNNKEHPYNIANHPKHLEALKEIDDLYTMSRPELKKI